MLHRNNKIYLLFGWVIDIACYAGPHLYQFDSYSFKNGKLVKEHIPGRFLYEGFMKGNEDIDISLLSNDLSRASNVIKQELQSSQDFYRILDEILDRLEDR